MNFSNAVRSLCIAMACAAIATPCLASDGSPILAPLHQSFYTPPVTNSSGETYYLVDLTADAKQGFSDQPNADGDRFASRHSAQAKNMVLAFEQKYGFRATTMTSYVGNSFSAYLDADQVYALRQDPLVTMVTELAPMRFSTSPPWYDSTYSSSDYPFTETSSWGRVAVNGKTSNQTGRVYVLDTGVAYHEDLNNVTRANATSTGTELVGCYPHATHVAGIISADYGNKGVAGVDAGVLIVSVSVGAQDSSPSGCAQAVFTTADVADDMDWIFYDQVFHPPSTMAVVNISMNGPDFTVGNTLNSKMLTLATPYLGGGLYYPGSLVVQSAGNGYQDACSSANGYGAFGYSGGTPSTSDGILVVGAIDYQGNPVAPSGGIDGFNYGSSLVGSEPGSNYGSCVEVWAPGKAILSTWGNSTGYNYSISSTWTVSTTTYADYEYIDGTSMSAPHIAGVAAYLSENNTYSNPGQLEAAVRSLFYNNSVYDAASYLVNMVVLP